MRRRNILFLALLLLSVTSFAQYPYSLEPEPTDSTAADSLVTDSLVSPSGLLQSDPQTMLVAKALIWARRLLYRGFLEDSETGTNAVYALTEWKEISGPFGPVMAHLSVTYLGRVNWLGKNAAWLQMTYRSLETDRPSVDLDLVVEPGEKVGEVYRALWRVNKGSFSSIAFKPPADEFDFDLQDRPKPGEDSELKLFSGSYDVTPYSGSGGNGAKVIAYRSDEVPPLSLVRLGYGGFSLNLRDQASDVEPKFEVPLPTTR
ncbi:MAG: hypothetical protein H6506_02520 [Calditrichaeota bacterium]|nr:hypothetical protein [Calditrichota bacterium]MCB9391507.1 hypothetical protein [Calditrichota bacterium]